MIIKENGQERGEQRCDHHMAKRKRSCPVLHPKMMLQLNLCGQLALGNVLVFSIARDAPPKVAQAGRCSGRQLRPSIKAELEQVHANNLLLPVYFCHTLTPLLPLVPRQVGK